MLNLYSRVRVNNDEGIVCKKMYLVNYPSVYTIQLTETEEHIDIACYGGKWSLMNTVQYRLPFSDVL